MANLTRKMQRAAERAKQKMIPVMKLSDGSGIGLTHDNAARMAALAHKVGAFLEPMDANEERDWIMGAFDVFDVVVAMYPSPDDPDSVRFHVMKGAHLVVEAGNKHGSTDKTTVIPVVDLEMAKAMERAWGMASGQVWQ